MGLSVRSHVLPDEEREGVGEGAEERALRQHEHHAVEHDEELVPQIALIIQKAGERREKADQGGGSTGPQKKK